MLYAVGSGFGQYLLHQRHFPRSRHDLYKPRIGAHVSANPAERPECLLQGRDCPGHRSSGESHTLGFGGEADRLARQAKRMTPFRERFSPSSMAQKGPRCDRPSTHCGRSGGTRGKTSLRSPRPLFCGIGPFPTVVSPAAIWGQVRMGMRLLGTGQILGVCIGQVDDASVVQCAGSFEWAEYNDFHEMQYRLPGPAVGHRDEKCLRSVISVLLLSRADGGSPLA